MILDTILLGLFMLASFVVGWVVGYMSSHNDTRRENIELTKRLKDIEATTSEESTG